MSIIKRKVYFYKLTIEEMDKSSKTIVLSENKTEKLFKTVYNKLQKIKNNNTKVFPIQYIDSLYIIEVVKYDNSIAIIKIGKQNLSDTVAIRDIKTYQSTNVPMSKDQNLELFTYCMFDFKTCIISYISIGFSPKISLLQEFINANIDRTKYHARISVVLCNDVMELISKKNIYDDLTISVSTPSDNILSNKFGLGLNDFDKIFVDNIKSFKITLRMSVFRHKSLFKDSKALNKCIDSIQRKFGGDIKSLKISAKNEDEKKQEFDILSYKFCKTVDLYDNRKDRLTEKRIIDLLMNTYENNKDELIKYSRIHYD